MAGTINTGVLGKALLPGVKSWYGLTYNEPSLIYPKVFEMKTSDKKFEEYILYSSTGLAPIKTEGSAISYDSETAGFVSRLTNVNYGTGVIVTKEALRDNQYKSDLQKYSKNLGFSIRQTEETVAFNVFNRAFSSSFLGADQVSLLNTA